MSPQTPQCVSAAFSVKEDSELLSSSWPGNLDVVCQLWDLYVKKDESGLLYA